MKKLLILDSNSILNRAYYGIRFLSSKDGTPTNAIYGFLNILIKLIREENPDYVCAAFDLKEPTFRHKKYAEYKAQRKPMPDDLKVQMPIAKEIIKAMGIAIYEKAGYEADDIIGTVSAMCDKYGIGCRIATGDKDDLQLVSDNTNVILTTTRMGQSETTIYDVQAVIDRYGVTPHEFIDVKALMGDPSDNIPGVQGVGEKTAIKLISQFHRIENIYKDLDATGLKGAMLRNIENGRESAFMSKELATIVRNVPIAFAFPDCTFRGFKDCGGLYEMLSDLGLNTVIKKMGIAPAGDTKAKNADIFDGMLVKKRIPKLSGETVCACVFGFEQDDLVKFAAAVGKIVYICDINGNAEAFDEVKSFLENEKIQKITFDVKDAIVKLNGKIDIKGICDDTAIAAYLVDPAKSEYTIDKLCEEYFGVELSDNEERQISLIDSEETSSDDYLAKCAAALFELNTVIKDTIKYNGQESLYTEIELPLVKVLADMQIDGVLIGREALEQFGDMLSVRIDELQEGIYKEAGREFNINSPKQLGEILYDEMGLKSGKKTHRGYSTSAESLEKIRSDAPIVGLVLEYRKLTKLKSTYCDGLSAVIAEDGRIHSVFTQTVTLTGRISSTEPNMQNIPTRTELGRELRKMFTAKDGCLFVDADYSQIELRVLAHIANDETMITAFKNDEDIHRVTASQVFEVPMCDVTPTMRTRAKAVNFGIVYGIGEYSLSQDLGIAVAEARGYMENYLAKYHGVREYMEVIKQKAKKDGYVKTLMNRIRYIPELKSPNHNIRAFGERVALNTPIQGTAADIIKLAMVRVHKRLSDEGLAARLILQVHDELIVETPYDEVDRVKDILKSEMETAMGLKVPLIVDMKTGKSWYDTK